MKCPLTYTEKLESYQGRDYGVLSCLKEECAWWDHKNSRCVKVSDSYNLSYIRAALENIPKELSLIRPPGK